MAKGAHNENAVYDYADGVDYQVYRIKDGATLHSEVYNADAEVDSSVLVVRIGNTCHVTVKGDKPCKVSYMNVSEPKKVNGGEFCEKYEMQGKNLVLYFAQGGTAEVEF